MQELLNFSVHPGDIGRFDDDWSAVADYVHGHGLDGIELLIGDAAPPAMPPGMTVAVHLPFWVSWLTIWQGHSPPPWSDLERYLSGGRNAEELVLNLRQSWLHAAHLQPAYMVFHVCHVELAHAFTRAYTYTSADVCRAAADLLNATAATFPNGEPPVRVFLENLWWPGLTFTDAEATDALVERLTWNNWAFVLDTGHLMNTHSALFDESEAVAYVLAQIEQLPSAIRQRIEGVHLHTSLSGAYQQQAQQQGLPDQFAQRSRAQQYGLVHEHVTHIDQHQPFTTTGCADIVAALCPHFITHEFIGTDTEHCNASIRTQRAVLHANKEQTNQ
ncbi:MAG: sugar phosphate isomerase [Chloroflexaceae bacterium]|nr:sugar phosphate isomerase [Chloroflexaceae bacterium]